MGGDLYINSRVTIPLTEISYTASRSSGPGGQHVNKADTRIQLRWNVRTSVALDDSDRTLLGQKLARRLTGTGDLVLACDTFRSQRRNREEVTERLVEIIQQALQQPKKRKPSRPTRAAKEKRRQQKQRRSKIKKSRQKPDTDE